MLEWMAWTLPTAVFFAVIAAILAGMTVWEIARPSVPRRGFLPLVTTRGDRLFIGLLGSAYLHLVWIATTDATLWIVLALAAAWMAIVMRWG